MKTLQNDGYGQNSQDHLPTIGDAQKFDFNDVWGSNESPIVLQTNLPAAPYRTTPSNNLVKQTEEADQDLQKMIEDNKFIEEDTKSLLFRNQSLIERIFPTQQSKLVSKMQTNMIQSAFEFRLNLFKVNAEFRLESAREHYNAVLLTIRGEYRARVSNFMMARLTDLHQVVDEKQRSFFAIACSKWQYAQTLPPIFRDRYMAVIDSEAEGFLNFTIRQIKHFESIIDEQIERLK